MHHYSRMFAIPFHSSITPKAIQRIVAHWLCWLKVITRCYQLKLKLIKYLQFFQMRQFRCYFACFGSLGITVKTRICSRTGKLGHSSFYLVFKQHMQCYLNGYSHGLSKYRARIALFRSLQTYMLVGLCGIFKKKLAQADALKFVPFNAQKRGIQYGHSCWSTKHERSCRHISEVKILHTFNTDGVTEKILVALTRGPDWLKYEDIYFLA